MTDVFCLFACNYCSLFLLLDHTYSNCPQNKSHLRSRICPVTEILVMVSGGDFKHFLLLVCVQKAGGHTEHIK